MGNKKDISIMHLAKSDKDKKIIRCVCIFLGEFFGTFMLLFFGCMSQLWEGSTWMIGVHFGLVLTVCFQVWSIVSGCYINPAITLAALIFGILHPLMSLVFLLAQILGAFAGYACLKGLEEGTIKVTTCLTFVNPSLELWQGTLIEFVLTWTFTLSVCALWDPRNENLKDSTALRIGLILGCVIISGAPYTGASINPARSLAPAIYHNEWKHHWVYWVGPLGGAALASIMYRFMFKREESERSDSDITTLDAK